MCLLFLLRPLLEHKLNEERPGFTVNYVLRAKGSALHTVGSQ